MTNYTRDIGGSESLVGPKTGTGRGVYANNPAGLPKYHTGNDTASVYSQARILVKMSDPTLYAQYREALPSRARTLADVLVSESATGGVGYVDLLLQSANETLQEKVQISEVLSDGYVAYFFGGTAPVWAYTGTLLNTQQDEWYDAFHILFRDIIRGTRLAQNHNIVQLIYDSKIVEGSLLNMSTSITSESETSIPFQFQFLVRNVRYGLTNPLQPTDLANAGISPEALATGMSVASTATSMLQDIATAKSIDAARDAVALAVRPGASVSELQERGIILPTDQSAGSTTATSSGEFTIP